MTKVYVFLARGFEEIEALAVVDLLRRADIQTEMVSIGKEKEVKGAHDITVLADSVYETDSCMDGDMLVLPGGAEGTNGLMAHEGIRNLLFEYRNSGKKLAAICAAPSILGMNGLLKGKRATCFPGMEDKLLGAYLAKGKVVVDGQFITSKGLGTAIDFGLALVAELTDAATAERLSKGIQFT